MNADWERIYETFRVFGTIDPDAVLAAANRRRCLCFDSEIRRAAGVVGMLHVNVSGCPEHGRRE